MDLRKLQPVRNLLACITTRQSGSKPILSSEATDEEKVTSLLEVVKGRTAATGMGNDSMAETPPWVPIIATLSEISKNEQRAISRDMIVTLVFVLLLWVGLMLASSDLNRLYAPTLLMCDTIFGIIALLKSQASTWNNRRKEQETLDALADVTTSHKAIGLLLEAYTADQKGAVHHSIIGRAFAERLIILLNSQTSAEHAQLSASQRRLLYQQLATNESIPFKRGCIKTLLLLDATPRLLPLARLVVRDAATKEKQTLRAEARQALATIVARMDFGTVADIPRWIAQLPDYLIPGVTAPEDDWEQGTVALFALIRLLPQLTPAHAGLLSATARLRLKHAGNCILYMFISGTDTAYLSALSRFGPDFTLAVLTALEAVGQGSDLDFVSDRATMSATNPTLLEIRARARQIVPILTARRKAEEVSNVLLRGSSAPPAPSNQLLRAVTGNPLSEPAAELLRPDTTAPMPATNGVTNEQTVPVFVISSTVEETLVNRQQA